LTHSHLLALIVFSALVASVFAVLLRDDARSRLRFGAIVFVSFALTSILVGWLMHPFPS
jgi:uncharacterized membrane protein